MAVERNVLEMPPVVILLGGENSRFWPLGQKRHKALYEIGVGRPVLHYLLTECVSVGVREVVLVRRPEDNGVDEFLASNSFPLSIYIVVQPNPQGMADAVLCGVSMISGDDFFVLDGNQVFFSNVAEEMLMIAKQNAAPGMVTVRRTKTPERFGVVIPDPSGNFVERITEKPQNLDPPQWRITATYYLSRNFLGFLEHNRANSASGFEIALDQYARHHRVGIVPVDGECEDVTLKYPWDIFGLHAAVLSREFPDGGSFIHPTAFVHPKAVVDGLVYIDAGAKIMEFATVRNYSVIGKNSVVGSYSLVRDYSFLGEDVVVGAHSEVVRSLLYNGVHLHRNFVGDSVLDRGASFGAGTITANRRHDRKTVRSTIKSQRVDSNRRSLGVIIGEGARVGINCSLRPGVKIGNGTLVYENVLIKEDLSDGVILRDDGTIIRP